LQLAGATLCKKILSKERSNWGNRVADSVNIVRAPHDELEVEHEPTLIGHIASLSSALPSVRSAQSEKVDE
jgi:hypothetical protein